MLASCKEALFILLYVLRYRSYKGLCFTPKVTCHCPVSSHPSSITLPPFPLFSPPVTTLLFLTSAPHLSSYHLHSPSTTVLPAPPLSLISRVNNSTAVHTWAVIAELHVEEGGLEGKWTIRGGGIKKFPTAPLQGRRNLPSVRSYPSPLSSRR